jgi:FSR family fosmidomycin resistance protein-like MFS transporter
MNTIPPLLPYLAQVQGLSLAQTGLVLSAQSFTASFLQPLAGLVLDRWGSPWVLAASLAYTAVLVSLIGFFPAYPVLLVLFTLAGFGSSLLHPLGSVTATRAAGSQPGLAISLYSTGGNLGFALGPVVAVPLVTRFGIRALAYLLPLGLLYALSFIWLRRALPRVEPAAPVKGRGRPVLGDRPTRWGALALLNVVNWLRAWAQYIVIAYFPYHFIQQGYPVTVSGPLMSIFLLAGTLGTFFAGFLADHLGRRSVVGGSLIASLAAAWLSLSTRGPLAWMGIAVLGAALHALMPISIVIAQELAPGHAGLAAGMMMGLAFGLGGLCTPIIGFLADTYGLSTALASFYPIVGLALLLFLLLPAPARAGVESGAGRIHM